jgi:hypothetical protein
MREMNLASQYFVAVQSVIAPHSFLHRASSCFAKFLLASTGSEERHPFSFWHQNWVIRGTLEIFEQEQCREASIAGTGLTQRMGRFKV